MKRRLTFIVAVVALLLVAGLVATRSHDWRARPGDRACEDHTYQTPSPDGRLVASYTDEACDYGATSSYVIGWIDVAGDGKTYQVLQTRSPPDNGLRMAWLSDHALQIILPRDLPLTRSAHRAGNVAISYVTLGS